MTPRLPHIARVVEDRIRFRWLLLTTDGCFEDSNDESIRWKSTQIYSRDHAEVCHPNYGDGRDHVIFGSPHSRSCDAGRTATCGSHCPAVRISAPGDNSPKRPTSGPRAEEH